VLQFRTLLDLANIHGLACDGCDLLVDDQLSDALALPSRGSSSERVMAFFFDTLVRFDKVAEHFGASCGDDARVDIGPGSKVVEDTCRDGGRDERECILSRHVRFPATLEDGHGCEASRSHRYVGKLVCRTVRVDREQVGAGDVDACEYERGADVPLMLVETLFEHRHGRDHAGLSACRERVQLHVGRDQGGDELGISGGPRAATANVVGDEVYLFAVLVGDDGALCGTRVCAEDDSVFEEAAHDGGTRAGRLGQRQALFSQEVVSYRVRKVECS